MVKPTSEMNFLEALGHSISAGADPNYLPRFNQQLMVQDEQAKRDQQMNALRGLARKSGLPNVLAQLGEVSPELLPSLITQNYQNQQQMALANQGNQLKQLEDIKKQLAARNQAENKFAGAADEFRNVGGVIDESIGLVEQSPGRNPLTTLSALLPFTNPNTTGLSGSALSLIPGTKASDLASNLSTIKADSAFSTLQEMRNNSPTGGALGSVTENELKLLANSRAALDQSQSKEQLAKNLKRYKEVRSQAFERTAEAFKQDFGYYPPGFNQEAKEGKPNRLVFDAKGNLVK